MPPHLSFSVFGFRRLINKCGQDLENPAHIFMFVRCTYVLKTDTHCQCSMPCLNLCTCDGAKGSAGIVF